jgi:hypothetical protein
MPPTQTKNTAEVDIDVGILYVAPIGTSEPASATATLDTAWREVGYTEDGSTFTSEITAEDVFVEELLDPVRVVNTARTSKLAFQMAQMVRSNLGLALNQGAAVTDSMTSLGPVAAASEVRVMLLWLSEATGASQHGLLARQCYNTGGLEINNRKAPDKRLLPVEFSLEKPSSSDAFSFLPSYSGII